MNEQEDEKLIKVEYRNWLHGLPPKRIKLDIEGWAGENTWKVPQAWHCKPYADANTYGCEIIYTWQTTCTVSCDDKGVCTFEGDFSKEKPSYLGKKWEPFASFAPFHFGYVAMVDIKTPPGHNMFLLPHPRFFSDRDGSCPCAVPGMLEMDWWPEIFFMVFRAPLPGHKLIFKHGDPIAQFLVVPRNIKYDIAPMEEKEADLRATRQHNLEKHWNRLCTRIFYCEDDKEFFDNKYKVLSNINSREGYDAVSKIMDKPKLIPHWNNNPQVVDLRPPEKQDNIHHQPWTEEELKKFAEKPKEVQVENLLKDKDKLEAMTDDELEKLVGAFKRKKRQERQERSMKLKSQSNPVDYIKKVMHTEDKPKDSFVREVRSDGEEYVLGLKIEKIKKK